MEKVLKVKKSPVGKRFKGKSEQVYSIMNNGVEVMIFTAYNVNPIAVGYCSWLNRKIMECIPVEFDGNLTKRLVSYK